jgi:hypothetical protein
MKKTKDTYSFSKCLEMAPAPEHLFVYIILLQQTEVWRKEK